MQSAIDIIHQDHVNLDQVLDVLESEVDRLPASLGPGDSRPDLELLHRIVYYIRVFPDRIHHPKEERFLFPMLAERAPELKEVIGRLQQQHAEGEDRLAALQAALKTVDDSYPDGLDELRTATASYIAFQREHMGLEERELLPAARRVLKSDDWPALDRAFARDSDPMFGANLETGFRALFERIKRSRPRREA